MSSPSVDEQFLRRALDLACQSIGLASPNPHVGAVIVDSEGNVAGEAFHTYDGVKHAEILALEQAGQRARGGTLYINLEPHSYQSRTPPCTDALIAAGVKSVVASMPDPNPSVSGRGFEQLRAAGISVEVGKLRREARQLNEAFARYIRAHVPFVTLKSAMSLDAKIGLSHEGDPIAGIPAGGWITGEAARAHVQQQRHESDSILVGVGTILADDPLLTDRTGKLRRRPLLRVILDSHLRIPVDSRIVQSAVAQVQNKGDVLIFCASADEEKKRSLQSRGIRVEPLAADSHGRPDIYTLLRHLGELEITSLLIEGGSTVNAMALAAGVVDKVFVYYAPKLLGSQAVSFVSSAYAIPPLEQLANPQIHRFGEDVAVEGYLHDPYI